LDDIPRTSPRTSPPPALTRRSLLGGALALGFLGSGCSYPVGLGSSQTRIKYWHFMGASDGVIMNEMVGEFARQNPDLFVEENVLAWGEPYYTKIAMAGAGGRSPDVASFHLSRLTGLGPGRIIDPIADKLLLDGAAIILSKTRGFPWWATGLLLFRDAGILLAAIVVLRRKAHVATAASTGKLTTALLTLAALLYVADGPRSGRPALYLALVPFTLSFVQYGRRFLRAMRGR